MEDLLSPEKELFYILEKMNPKRPIEEFMTVASYDGNSEDYKISSRHEYYCASCKSIIF